MVLSHTELSRMLETAIVAARLAGQRAMEEMRYTRSSIKNNEELVTQADSICQKIILDRIKETYPDHGFIAEEGPGGSMLKWTPRRSEPIWWIIDPIDGTNNFANGLLCFTISIAAMADGMPVVGTIFEPATDSMYTAAADTEAQMNGSRIQVREQEISRFASFGIDSHSNPMTDAGVQAMMKKTRVRCLGSTALHLAYVARGSMIGAVSNRAKLWDLAAGILLIEQAGGVVIPLDRDSLFPIQPDTYEAETYCFLTSNCKCRKDLLKIFGKE